LADSSGLSALRADFNIRFDITIKIENNEIDLIIPNGLCITAADYTTFPFKGKNLALFG
jgi:hypothetical protein